MPAKLQNEWRSTAIFTGMIFMMSAVFMSRALLSVSIIAFVVISLLHKEHKKQLQIFFQQPLLWSMSLLFIIPLVSGIWSSDLENWKDVMQVKIPLLVLPVAFASPFKLPILQWKILAWLFIALVTAGTAWSFFHYLSDVGNINENYLRAKTLTTILDNDYVRFSWITAIASLLAGWLGVRVMKKERILAISLLLVSSWLIIYLHVLAARTGLISLYLGLLIIILSLMIHQKKNTWILLLSIAIIPVTAYFFIPAFQNRIKYLRYEFDYAKHASYIPGSTDPVRVISINAGFSLMMTEPIQGVGFGDIDSETRQWYLKYYPGMKEEDKILPSSEYLLYGAGAGIPGLLVIIFTIAVPFFIKIPRRLLWLSLNATVAFCFLFDIGLEVQYGVFLYCFIQLASWKWLESEKI